MTSKIFVKNFFNLLGNKANGHCSNKLYVPAILQTNMALKSFINRIDPYTHNNYLYDNFTHWLSLFAHENPIHLHNYFLDKAGLDKTINHFIKFCFERGISLDKQKTLQSFEHHDELSDVAVKHELNKLKPQSQKEITLLGFGLGDGYYEKSLAKYLVEQNKTKTVKIYGFDPYAQGTDGIELLTANQLITKQAPAFDIITARWVLHHVTFQNRWFDLINCINRCKSGALVLVVEHGFLQGRVLPTRKKLYYLLNATFDVVANVGIRPEWFTSTSPEIGKHFYIHYLTTQDFKFISKNVKVHTTQTLYDVGPGFPNQSICSIQIH